MAVVVSEEPPPPPQATSMDIEIATEVFGIRLMDTS
jgi:hypothetical protein